MITINKTELEKLICVEKKSYREIGRLFNISDSYVKKIAKELGISLPNRRKLSEKETFNKGKKIRDHKCLNCGNTINVYYKGKKYCSLKCFWEKQTQLLIQMWKANPNKFNKEQMPSFIRKYILNKYNNKCEKCGWSQMNIYTNSIPLELHHIDGNCTNNVEENLELLCPNCHALTKTFGSLNKGNSKRYKLKEYKEKIKK